eukprot:SAG31_NODE_4210_length_3469_cov_11.547774_2_plen_235_part_00
MLLQIVVSNAYYSKRQPLLEQEWDEFQKTIEVTQHGAYHVCQLGAKAMIECQSNRSESKLCFNFIIDFVLKYGAYLISPMYFAEEIAGGHRAGKIIAITSVNAPHPYLIPGSTAYNMAKAAIEAMVQNMASALAGRGINVNAIRPGWILTRGEQQFMSVAEITAMANSALPLGIGLPEDVAKAAVYLASRDADYVNGITLPVDGGFSISQRVPNMHDPIERSNQPVHPNANAAT